MDLRSIPNDFLLSLAVLAVGILSVPLAFASSNYYGHIGTVELVEGVVHFTMENCDGSSGEFVVEGNTDTWVSVLAGHKERGEFVSIKVEGENRVSAIANVGGGTCDNLDEILSALDDKNENDVESDDDDRKEKIRERAREELNETERMHGGRDLNDEKKAELKLKLMHDMRLKNHDVRAVELEKELGFEHENDLRIRISGDEKEHQIRMRGSYYVHDEHHLLLNPMGRIMAELKIGPEKDFSSFVNEPVLVIGTAMRSEKMIDVESMKEVPEREMGDNMPMEKWKIGASLYNDIDSNDSSLWYTKYLELLYDRGIFSGYADGRFGGANDVTAAEVAKIIAEAAEHAVDAEYDLDLTAKQRMHWASKYLKNALKYRLMSNLNDPDRSANRQEVVEAVLKAYGFVEADLVAENLTDPFPDTDNVFVLKAYQLEIIGGYPDNTFRPDGKINRAEVAKIITRAIEVLEEDDGVETTLDEVFEER